MTTPKSDFVLLENRPLLDMQFHERGIIAAPQAEPTRACPKIRPPARISLSDLPSLSFSDSPAGAIEQAG